MLSSSLNYRKKEEDQKSLLQLGQIMKRKRIKAVEPSYGYSFIGLKIMPSFATHVEVKNEDHENNNEIQDAAVLASVFIERF